MKEKGEVLCLLGSHQRSDDNGTGAGDNVLRFAAQSQFSCWFGPWEALGEVQEPHGHGIVQWDLQRMEPGAARAPPGSSPALFGWGQALRAGPGRSWGFLCPQILLFLTDLLDSGLGAGGGDAQPQR